jgi:hypothetical protein
MMVKVSKSITTKAMTKVFRSGTLNHQLRLYIKRVHCGEFRFHSELSGTNNLQPDTSNLVLSVPVQESDDHPKMERSIFSYAW